MGDVKKHNTADAKIDRNIWHKHFRPVLKNQVNEVTRQDTKQYETLEDPDHTQNKDLIERKVHAIYVQFIIVFCEGQL